MMHSGRKATLACSNVYITFPSLIPPLKKRAMESGGSNPGSSHSERRMTSLPAWAEYKSPRHMVSVTRTVPSIEKAVLHRDDIFLQGMSSSRQTKKTSIMSSPELSPHLYRKGLVPPLNLAALSESRNSSLNKNYNHGSHNSSPDGQESAREWDLTPRGVGPGQGLSQANLSQEILARLQEASISRSPSLQRRHPRTLGKSRDPNNSDIIASGPAHGSYGNRHHGHSHHSHGNHGHGSYGHGSQGRGSQHNDGFPGNTYPVSSVPGNTYPSNSNVAHGITSPDYAWSFQGMQRQGLRDSAAGGGGGGGGSGLLTPRRGMLTNDLSYSQQLRRLGEEGEGREGGGGEAGGGGRGTGDDTDEDWPGCVQGFSPREAAKDTDFPSDMETDGVELEMVRKVNSPSAMNSSSCRFPKITTGRLTALMQGGRETPNFPQVVGIGRKRQPEEPTKELAREQRKEPKQPRGASLVIKLPSVNDNVDKR